jgi:hypothetical protein
MHRHLRTLISLHVDQIVCLCRTSKELVVINLVILVFSLYGTLTQIFAVAMRTFEARLKIPLAAPKQLTSDPSSLPSASASETSLAPPAEEESLPSEATASSSSSSSSPPPPHPAVVGTGTSSSTGYHDLDADHHLMLHASSIHIREHSDSLCGEDDEDGAEHADQSELAEDADADATASTGTGSGPDSSSAAARPAGGIELQVLPPLAAQPPGR